MTQVCHIAHCRVHRRDRCSVLCGIHLVSRAALQVQQSDGRQALQGQDWRVHRSPRCGAPQARFDDGHAHAVDEAPEPQWQVRSAPGRAKPCSQSGGPFVNLSAGQHSPGTGVDPTGALRSPTADWLTGEQTDCEPRAGAQGTPDFSIGEPTATLASKRLCVMRNKLGMGGASAVSACDASPEAPFGLAADVDRQAHTPPAFSLPALAAPQHDYVTPECPHSTQQPPAAPRKNAHAADGERRTALPGMSSVLALCEQHGRTISAADVSPGGAGGSRQDDSTSGRAAAVKRLSFSQEQRQQGQVPEYTPERQQTLLPAPERGVAPQAAQADVGMGQDSAPWL